MMRVQNSYLAHLKLLLQLVLSHGEQNRYVPF